MKHVNDQDADAPGPVCLVLKAGDSLVDSALESDCDDCRTVCNVGLPVRSDDPAKVNNDPYKIRPTPSYEPKPLSDAASLLEEKRRKVDGR